MDLLSQLIVQVGLNRWPALGLPAVKDSVCPAPWKHPTNGAPNSGLQYHYGVDCRTLRWISVLEMPRVWVRWEYEGMQSPPAPNPG